MIGPVPELDDVAVIDINLRGCSAYPIADELMRIGKPFVFTTGYGADAIPHRFRQVRRWEKPYEIEKVTADVAALCGGQPL